MRGQIIRKIHTAASSVPKGLVGLITGANEGLGRAVATRFFNLGSRLVLLTAEDTDCGEIVDEVSKDDYLCYPGADILSEEDLKPIFEKTKERFGRLDFAINTVETADAHVIFNPLRIQTAEEFEQQYNYVFQTNLHGTFNICRLAAELMSQNQADDEGQRGCIINTSHICATDGLLGTCFYAASKAAVNSMTLPMSRDLAHLGIRVNTIQMGMMETQLHNTVGQVREKEYYKFCMPFPKRFGEPEEFAHLCEHVLTNRYLNGEIIKQDCAFIPAFFKYRTPSE